MSGSRWNGMFRVSSQRYDAPDRDYLADHDKWAIPSAVGIIVLRPPNSPLWRWTLFSSAFEKPSASARLHFCVTPQVLWAKNTRYLSLNAEMKLILIWLRGRL